MPITSGARMLLPGTRGEVLATIQGDAQDALGAPLPGVRLRLRDARFGHIAAATDSDTSGRFAFEGLDPGTYVVELMTNEGDVAASSDLLNVEAGDVVSAIVKLPFKKPPFGLLGQMVPAAVAIATAAATSGVLAQSVAGDPDSP